MTVTIVRARPDAKRIGGKWLREQVQSLADDDRQGLTKLINIERQFGGADIDYLFQLRAWMNDNERRSDAARVPDSEPDFYDVE
jgi:hypothetical protein